MLPVSHLFKHTSPHCPRALSADDRTSYFMEKIETLRRELLPTHLHTPTHLATPAPTYFAFLPTTMLRCPSPSSRPTPWPLSIRLPSLLAHSRKLLLLLQHWLFLPLLNHAHQHIPKKKKKRHILHSMHPSNFCLIYLPLIYSKSLLKT